MKLAQTSIDKLTLVKYPLSESEAFALFPPNTSPVSKPNAATFANVPVVIVEPTPPPELGPDERRSVTAVRDGDVWREQWTVVPPTSEEIASAKKTLKAEALERARQEAWAARPLPGPIAADLADVETRIDAAATIASAKRVLAERHAG